MLTVKVMTTDPAAGIVNVPKIGLVSPMVGLTIAVCVAPPFRTTPPVDAYVNPAGSASEMLTAVAEAVLTALATVIEEVAVVPATVLVTLGVLVVLVVVRAGRHSAPEDDPGIDAGVVVRTRPASPLTEPYVARSTVVPPCAPPATVVWARGRAFEVMITPPPPPPPGPW